MAAAGAHGVCERSLAPDCPGSAGHFWEQGALGGPIGQRTALPPRAAPIPCPPPPTLPDRGDGRTGHGAAACTYAQHPRPSGTCAAASGSGRVRAGGWSSAQGRARGRPGRCRRPGILSHIWTRDPTCHFALGPARYAAGLVTDPPPHPASLHRAPRRHPRHRLPTVSPARFPRLSQAHPLGVSGGLWEHVCREPHAASTHSPVAATGGCRGHC